jgi:hypothetical protein
MSITEEQVNRWAHPPSETEDARCENAVSQITDALRAHFGDDIYFVRQGSHRNRTNIKTDSDIDLAVGHKQSYFPDISGLSEYDKTLHKANSTDAAYRFAQFKTDVNKVLQAKFGLLSVERKNKCIRITGNSSRVNADVVPVFKHKRFSSYGVVSVEGLGFITDIDSKTIYSFPEQHYTNGVKKNDGTSRSYKSVVRILKNVRKQLIEDGKIAKDLMSSFFIESLVWNVPNGHFKENTYRGDVLSVTAKVWSDMRNAEIADKYAEVSDLQWLFRGSARTYKQAEDFMLQAWLYLKV